MTGSTMDMKETELRDLIDSLRPPKTELWGDGLGVLCFFFFAFLPFLVLGPTASPLFVLWSGLLCFQGVMCMARFFGALRLREKIDSGLAKIDGETDPHRRLNEFRRVLAKDLF